MSKIKASQNKAANIETPSPPKTIGEMTSEALGLALNQQYQQLQQSQMNILQINGELERRKARHNGLEKEMG